jgi:hypothetical protein
MLEYGFNRNAKIQITSGVRNAGEQNLRDKYHVTQTGSLIHTQIVTFQGSKCAVATLSS